MLSKYLDPKNDFAFKRVFGSERNKDILIHFLNDMIVFENNAKVAEVQFLKTVQDPEIAAKKTSLVDVMCTDQNGNHFIVEMQVAKEKGFEKRAQYYAAKAYGGQLNAGELYDKLCSVYFLAITNFVIFENHDRVKTDHAILDRESYAHELKDLQFTFVELPKFKKGIHELTTIFDKWCYFFKYADETYEKDLSEIAGCDTVIFKAYEEVNKLGWSEAERNTYEQMIKYERDAQAIIEQQIDEAWETGKAEGIAQGIAQGISQGKAEGREEGRAEGEKAAALRIARQLKANGLSDMLICEATGLSLRDLDDLKMTETIGG